MNTEHLKLFAGKGLKKLAGWHGGLARGLPLVADAPEAPTDRQSKLVALEWAGHRVPLVDLPGTA
jgi:hypothetical protein